MLRSTRRETDGIKNETSKQRFSTRTHEGKEISICYLHLVTILGTKVPFSFTTVDENLKGPYECNLSYRYVGYIERSILNLFIRVVHKRHRPLKCLKKKKLKETSYGSCLLSFPFYGVLTKMTQTELNWSCLL